MTSNDRGNQDRRRFLKLSGAGTLGITGLAGCLTGGGGSSTTSTSSGDTSSDETSSGSETTSSGAKDFGGKEISVMLNVGAISTIHKKYLIPRVEEKYNLNINTETAVTTTQLTKLQANQDSPPDVVVPDVIGIEKASRKGWLEPLTDHPDAVSEVDNIYDKFVHYDGAGVSWEVGEVLPVINTSLWDNTPQSHADVMKNSNSTALVPFSWSGGPYLLLMASAIATGNSFNSELDVQAGFDWLETNLKPNVTTTYQGAASAKQQLASGNVDALNLFWDYMLFDMWKRGASIDPLFRLEPAGVAFAEAVGVTKNAPNQEAAFAYANECLSPWFQEKASAAMGCGVTNKNATVNAKAKEFGAVTSDEFDQLAFPDFGYIWENRSDWAEQWNNTFS